MPIREPASTSRSSPRRIARPPKDFVSPRTASCGTYDMVASVAARGVGGNRASRTAEDEMAPKIHVGPDDPEHLIRAVRDGGGEPVRARGGRGGRLGGQAEGPARAARRASAGCSCPPRASSRGWSACATRRTCSSPRPAAPTPRRSPSSRSGLLIAGVRGFAHYARREDVGPAARADARGLDGRDRRRGRDRPRADRHARPHDVEVIAVTRSGRDGTLPVDRIDEIWAQADHFVIAAPATDATKHIVGERRAGGDAGRTRGSSTSPAGR